ncbi:hypothetical protein [Brachybacterium sp. GPGPB12]|uniref:hypothetical protein n=1 Tax=Brachybacterium sp. GPGPB12 TaxID=3023517 RepID=UPI0031343039
MLDRLKKIAKDLLAITWIRRTYEVVNRGFLESFGSNRILTHLFFAVNPLAFNREQSAVFARAPELLPQQEHLPHHPRGAAPQRASAREGAHHAAPPRRVRPRLHHGDHRVLRDRGPAVASGARRHGPVGDGVGA